MKWLRLPRNEPYRASGGHRSKRPRIHLQMRAEPPAQLLLLKQEGPACGGPLRAEGKSIGQGMVLLATLDSELSAPALVYADTAKYQVPDVNPFTTYVARLGLAISTV